MSASAPAAPTVTATPPKQPETKFGPFAGGMSVAIWRNTVDTDDGPRDIRSLTINPRRYKDAQSGEWKNGSYRASDVGVLILALTAAQQFMAAHPLPQPAEEEPPESHNGQETPF
jgi:hypothetical protein